MKGGAPMASRRNTCTAVLFLCGLFAAVIYLGLGTIPEPRGFAEVRRPGHSTRADKAFFLSQAEKKAKEEKRDLPAMVRTQVRPICRSLGTSLPTYEGVMEAFTQYTENSDPALHALLDRDHLFIELYGGAQKLMGRRMVEDTDPQYTVVKLENDLLTFSDPNDEAVDMKNRAEEMVAFARRVHKEYRTPLLYVQAPSKLSVSDLPDGLKDSTETEADQFLALLEAGKVDTLDLRPAFRAAAEEDPDAAAELFFQTDHHWTPAGAFLGYQILCEKLEEDYRFKLDEELLDPDYFNKYSFGEVFLGSQGRRVGSSYGGLDDLEIWSPKEPTHFTYSVPIVGIKREGPFVTSLLFPERLADIDLYNDNPYTIYAGGDYMLSRAYNEDLPRGKRVLILRDSFGCGLTPFLSLCCQEVMAMDPRQFNGNQDLMLHYIDWLEPDLIIVMNTTGSLRVDKLFPYLPTARANALEQKRLEEK